MPAKCFQKQIKSVYRKKDLFILDSEATKKVGEYIGSIPGFSFTNPEDMNKLVGYGYGISAKYGEGAQEVRWL